MGERINLGQLITIGVGVIYPTLVIVAPGVLIRDGGRWGWLTLVVVGAGVALVAALAFRSPVLREEGVIGACLRLAGPWVGRAVLVVVWLVAAAYAMLIVRQLGVAGEAEYVSGDVPLYVLDAMPVILATLVAAGGVGVLARVAGVVIPFLVLNNIPWIGLSLPSLHLAWLRPLAPADLRFLSVPALSVAGTFMVEVFLLGIWTDRLRTVPRARDGSLMVLKVVGVVLLLGVAAVVQVIAFFGPQRGGQFLIPEMELARELAYPDFVQGLDAIASPFFILGGMVKLAFYELTLLRLQKSIVPFGAARWHAVAIGVVLSLAAMMLVPNTVVLLQALGRVGEVGMPVFGLLPLGLVFGSALAPARRRRAA